MHEQDPGNLVRVPPDEYFGFPACRMCMWKSCKDLRYGGVHPGKFIFVHSRDYAGSGCVFLAESFDEIQDLLSSLPLQDLDLLVRDIIFDLSPGEQLHYDQRHFVWDFCDRAGRIAYLRRLWEDWAIVCLRVPFGYRSDPRLRSWLHATSGAYGFQLKGFEQEEDEGPALTDALADELTRAHPSLRNPAWSHTDETRREQSPKEAAYGDTVLLTADVRNIVDGARVTIEVFDTAVKPPRSVAQVRGTVQEQQARAEWTVERPKNAEEDEEGPRYEFEARYEGAKTGRCEIPSTEDGPRGGATVRLCDGSSHLIEDAMVILRAGSKELFNDVVPDGVLEVADIPPLSLELECEYGGRTIIHPIRWTAGEGPYTVQVIALTPEKEKEEPRT